MSLHNAAVLVKLTIRCWDGFKQDKRVSERADAVFHTAGSAGNYNKRLLAKHMLSPMTNLMLSTRMEHKRLTLPWCFDGVDLLPSRSFLKYSEYIRGQKDQLDQAVANFVQQYPVYRADQATRLGDMFNADDYPSADTIASRYALTTMFFPVPKEGHFAVDMAVQDELKAKASLAAALVEAQKNATRTLYERVFAVIERIYKTLEDPEAVFRDSMLGNAKQLVEVVPNLNIFDDPHLVTVCEDISNRLLLHNADTLRTDKLLREQVAQAAKELALDIRTTQL